MRKWKSHEIKCLSSSTVNNNIHGYIPMELSVFLWNNNINLDICLSKQMKCSSILRISRDEIAIDNKEKKKR